MSKRHSANRKAIVEVSAAPFNTCRLIILSPGELKHAPRRPGTRFEVVGMTYSANQLRVRRRSNGQLGEPAEHSKAFECTTGRQGRDLNYFACVPGRSGCRQECVRNVNWVDERVREGERGRALGGRAGIETRPMAQMAPGSPHAPANSRHLCR